MKLEIVLCLICVGSVSLGAPQNYNYNPSSSNSFSGKSSPSPFSGSADLSAFYPYSAGSTDLSAFYPYSAGPVDFSAFYPYSAGPTIDSGKSSPTLPSITFHQSSQSPYSVFFPYTVKANPSLPAFNSVLSPQSYPAATNPAAATQSIPSVTALKSFQLPAAVYSVFKAFQLPTAATPVFKAAKGTPSPLSAAALAYLENAAGGNDICTRSAKTYLETILAGGSADEATNAAAKQYHDDYNSGLKAAPGSACEASDIAWRKAMAEGTDPLLDSTVAFMENWPGTRGGNPCAVAGKEYVNSVLQGSSQVQANLVAAKSFAAAFQSLAAQGQELRDPACAAATKAFYANLDRKSSPSIAAAMLAFIDKAFDGFSLKYDPVCWRSAETFFDSYAAGNNELTSTLAASETFLDEFANGGAGVPADSPCAAAARAYYANNPNPPSPTIKAAMEAFMNKMIAGGKRQPDPACAASTKAYVAAYKSGVSEADATLAAAESFIQSYATGQSLPANSPCFAAATAYYNSLPSKPSSPSAEAMVAFMNKMVANGNKREYDPACANAALAYFNSYKAGEAELMSTFRAAKAFIAQYKSGAKVPADSPCLEASKLFSNSITNKPNKQTAAAMFAFTDEAVLSNMNQADGVCLKAAEAYFDAFLAGASEAKATEAAGAAFIEAAAFSRDFDPNGPCAKSAQAYMDGHL